MKDKLNITEAYKAVDAMTSVCSKGKAEIKELLATLVGEKYEPSREQMFPRVDCGRYYYVIDEVDDVRTYQERGCVDDSIRYSRHNYFLTKEEAEEERLYTIARRKLQKMAHYLNGDWKPDYANDRIIVIRYEHNSRRYALEYAAYRSDLNIPFKSGELASQALEMLTEDEKKILFKRGE